MNTQISVETLSPITYKQTNVITSELLAQLYGTDVVRIRQNHHENKSRFVEGYTSTRSLVTSCAR